MSKISHKLKNSLSARLVSYVIGGFAITGVIFFALIFEASCITVGRQPLTYVEN